MAAMSECEQEQPQKHTENNRKHAGTCRITQKHTGAHESRDCDVAAMSECEQEQPQKHTENTQRTRGNTQEHAELRKNTQEHAKTHNNTQQ